MTDVIPSEDEIQAARKGIYTQLLSTKLSDKYGSLSQAIEELNLYDFIENQVQVIASSRAWSREADKVLHAKLEQVTNEKDKK